MHICHLHAVVLSCDWMELHDCDSGASFRSVSLYGTPQNGSPVVVFFDHWHPGLWDFNSIVLVDAVKVKFSIASFTWVN